MGTLTDALAQRAVDRSVAERQSEYSREIQRILEATYGLIERSGSLDPSLRDILRETGLSTQAFYKYFQSKDELMLLLLDDGRHKLVSYLDHRMAKASSPEGAVRAWIEGVLAQAADPVAAAKTRPFFANLDRLAEAFPAEQQASVDVLIDQLAAALGELTATGSARTSKARPIDARQDAEAIYHMVFGLLHKHLVHGSQATGAEIDHLARFALRGAGAGASGARRRS